jgi:ADP-ribosyl-[dinitrogen reductase] hydrolase
MKPPVPELQDRFRGCLLGLAVGDALGATVEFRPRGSFDPLTDMVGGGPFGLRPGEWTDDTAMALCLAISLIECQGFDARDQMERYCRWVDEGYMSSTGRCFDIGHTVASALRRYRRTGNPYAGDSDPFTAGNGCIMRLAPVPMFYFPDLRAAEQYAAESSRVTHAAAECLDACRLLSRIIVRALAGTRKELILLGDAETFTGAPAIVAIARGQYLDKSQAEIRGSGYVVESLEAALWCFARTDTLADAVLMAANLGDDADTTAAVCGQVAGAYYGASALPPSWLGKLARADYIIQLADRLFLRQQR